MLYFIIALRNNVGRRDSMHAKNSQTAKRLTALVFLLCLMMVALLSEACVLALTGHTHAHHDHAVNNECVVCAHIKSVGNLLKQFGAAVNIALLGLAGLFAVLAMLYFLAASFAHQTPVYLKIRLNN